MRTYEFYIDDDRYSVPTLHLITAPDLARAQELAHVLMAESDHHLGVELCRSGERLLGLGSYAPERCLATLAVATAGKAGHL